MDRARTPNELERLADIRFQNALATEARLKATLKPTHRLLAKDAKQIYTPPPASLFATNSAIGAARTNGTRRPVKTPPALGRASANAATLDPTHRLLAKDAKQINPSPSAGLFVSKPELTPMISTARTPGPRRMVKTPPALGRASATTWPSEEPVVRPGTVVGAVGRSRSGKRFTRGDLVRPPQNPISFNRQTAIRQTSGESQSGLSPTKQRAELLRQGFGETGGWWANEFVDLFDSVTPALEFFHRRRRNVPFGIEDVFIAASVIPGAGKVFGKAGRLATKSWRKKPTRRLKSKRDVEGIGTHDGSLPELREGKSWLRGSHKNAGKIPLEIAKKLEGRKFKNWRQFRRAFWKEVANLKELASQFPPKDVERMKRGLAPRVHKLQELGRRKTYNIDHNHELQHGGGLYDMDYLFIRTPLNHVKGK